MPLADIIGDIEGATPFSSGSAPEANNAPSETDSPTTMDTPEMLPPYLHNQTLGDRSALALVGTVIVLMQLLGRFV